MNTYWALMANVVDQRNTDLRRAAAQRRLAEEARTRLGGNHWWLQRAALRPRTTSLPTAA